MGDVIPDLSGDAVDREPCLRALWEYQREELHTLASAIATRCDAIVNHWYELCCLKLGRSRRLTQTQFSAIFSPYLRSAMRSVLDNRFDHFAASIEELSERLACAGVPFAEVTLTLHLCKQSISSVCADELSPERYRLLDSLTQIRAALLAEAYFRARSQHAQDETRAQQSANKGKGAEFYGLVGRSAAMRRIFDRIAAAARTRGTVLLVGESGTGKELVARAIHEAGMRAGAPFVAVNCPAIPRDLIESELFGHRRGAFSGANLDHPGLFRSADGGTLLLDEVTEMSLETQSKLLRVLQERSVRPVGSTTEIPVDVRLIASTNRRPDAAVRMGLIRQDLYYRLQASVIEIPPLRERCEDIPPLANHFVRLFNARAARPTAVSGIDAEAMAALLRYSWPGNVRELSNAIESAITFGRGERIGLDDLPAAIRDNEPAFFAGEGVAQASEVAVAGESRPPTTFEETERELIVRTLRIAGNNKTLAAELLHISRKKLYARLARYGLKTGNRRANREHLLSPPLAAKIG